MAPVYMLFRTVAFALALGATSFVHAQEALTEALPRPDKVAAKSKLPESAWLDLRQNAPNNSTTQTAPNWVESVAMVAGQAANEENAKSTFRIRVARPPGDYSVLFFRLFFDDKADARPELVAWDESGTQV
ncbi:MAG TPA: hypothetical protein VJ252_08605, partial [Chthoniobacterales bacterium]|nr:hypothetical protein [Chthoniobacterales bacterium]